MPKAKGTMDIPKRKRAQILAEKNTQLSTPSAIAAKYNVSRSTVHKITDRSVSGEVLAMASVYERKILTYTQAIAMKAQQRTFDTINELNAKDAAIVAEKNFKMVQIIQNRPTQIINEPTDEEIAKELFWRLVNNRQWSEEKALEGIKQAYPDVDTSKFLTD